MRLLLPPSRVLALALIAAAPALGRASGAERAEAAPVGPATPGAPAASSEAPADFAEDVKLLYRVVACQDESTLPPAFDAKVVKAYCKRQRKAMGRYREEYLPQVGPFVAKLRPEGLPTTVVYPFGGGDLVSALTTFPDARDVTTLSLEYAGDPRRLAKVTEREVLEDSLDLVRATTAGLLYASDSKTENLMAGQRGEIPGQLAFFVIGLAVHGYEPVSLRFFRIEQDGSLHYLTPAEITASETKGKAKLLRGQWTAPDFASAFSNSEIVFVKRGGDPTAGARVHRHIAADLSNSALEKNPGVLRFLESKGRIAAMTKAASYLLWRDDFSKVRNYLLARMDFMISDSTGIPPRYLARTEFVQETYGRFERSFLKASDVHNEAFQKLWASQPKRVLPFRFGYIDRAQHYHLLVTKRAPAKT